MTLVGLGGVLLALAVILNTRSIRAQREQIERLQDHVALLSKAMGHPEDKPMVYDPW